MNANDFLTSQDYFRNNSIPKVGSASLVPAAPLPLLLLVGVRPLVLAKAYAHTRHEPHHPVYTFGPMPLAGTYHCLGQANIRCSLTQTHHPKVLLMASAALPLPLLVRLRLASSLECFAGCSAAACWSLTVLHRPAAKCRVWTSCRRGPGSSCCTPHWLQRPFSCSSL